MLLRSLAIMNLVLLPILIGTSLIGERIALGSELFHAGNHSAGSLAMFAIMLYPSLCLGTGAYSVILFLLSKRLDRSGLRWSAFLLAPVVPAVPDLLEWSVHFDSATLPTTVATACFGGAAARWLVDRDRVDGDRLVPTPENAHRTVQNGHESMGDDS